MSCIFLNLLLFLLSELRQPLIAGIDPGTTTGYAVLDLKGRLLRLGAVKGIGLSRLLSLLTRLGRVVVVGCDKAPTPAFVLAVATKLGARLVVPRQNLSKAEKLRLTAPYGVKAGHKGDALAGAVWAFKEIMSLLAKIERTVGRDEELAAVLKTVVLTKRLAIKKALTALGREAG